MTAHPKKPKGTVMSNRLTRTLVTLSAAAAVAVPAVAQARGGSDDPANHVRHEHHQVVRDDRGADDAIRHTRRSDDAVRHARRGADDAKRHGRRGADDGPQHR
jgi:Spy/CpxP family protein refolding chaperone